MANSATTPRNNILFNLGFLAAQKNSPHGGSAVSFDYNQGDLMYFDFNAGYVKPLDSDANAAFLEGVATHSAYVAPYASTQAIGGPAIAKNFYGNAQIQPGGVATFFSAAEVYAHGQAVYYGTDAQTICKTGTHAVGTVYLPDGTTITGSATTLVPIRVISQIPAQGL